jgi:colicin import membrane protein
MAEIVYATAEDDAETVPAELRCIWPGCTRRRAPGRTAGSGRQREYCLKADRPEKGDGPVHNARNRWAWRRIPGSAGTSGGDAGERSGATAAADGVHDTEAPPSVRDNWPVSAARSRAGELLEQARRQHSAALASLQAERELYQQLGEQFRVMSDPAALDLEIAAIGLAAGRDVAQAGEAAARAQRAQLRAERERDEALRLKEEADAAAEQFAADTEIAELTLAQRTSEFERERDLLLTRVREAADRADRVTAEAAAAKTAAQEAVAAAEERADAQIERARQQAAQAAAEARRQVTEARQQAAEQIALALADAERARTATERARADAEAMREAVRQARDDAQARIATAEASAAAANARAAVIKAEIERLRAERAEELARLEAAHNSVLEAERARAKRAEDELDALRAGPVK